ncbi:MAG TPA: GNAT family N-acetyltransferase [Spirochaetota bacterium]
MEQIEWIQITPADFDAYAPKILKLENDYPEELRDTYDDISDGICREGSVALAFTVDGKFAGFALAYQLIENEIYEYDLAGAYPHDAIYLESITVVSSFRGRGLGVRLLAECARRARDAGYRYMVGHFRKNGSLTAARHLGMREINVVPDWRGAGEPFVCGVIDLSSIPTNSTIS